MAKIYIEIIKQEIQVVSSNRLGVKISLSEDIEDIIDTGQKPYPQHNH